MTCLRGAARSALFWFLVFPLGAAIGAALGALYIRPIIEGPITVLLDTALITDQPIDPGGAIRFKITSRRATWQNCDGFITREFHRRVAVDGVETWEKYRMPMVPPPIPDLPADLNPDGTVTFVIAVPLPMNAEPGRWRFRGRTTCDSGFWLGGTSISDTPPIEFTIVGNEATRTQSSKAPP